MDWTTVIIWIVYFGVGLPYAIHINKDWFKKADNNKEEVDESMLLTITTFIACVWPIVFVVRALKKLIGLILLTKRID